MLPTTFHTAIGKCRVVHALLARLEILIPATDENYRMIVDRFIVAKNY